MGGQVEVFILKWDRSGSFKSLEMFGTGVISSRSCIYEVMILTNCDSKGHKKIKDHLVSGIVDKQARDRYFDVCYCCLMSLPIPFSLYDR